MRKSAYKILLNFVQYSKFQKMYALKKNGHLFPVKKSLIFISTKKKRTFISADIYFLHRGIFNPSHEI